MRKSMGFILASVALGLSAPAMAQSLTAADVGVAPLADVSATDYVKLAADADNFEIQSGKLAAAKSRRDDVKGFARQMVTDHTATTKSLMAALSNQDRKITPPARTLSSANQAKLDLLKKAPKATFDQLYLTQQVEAHQNAWALHKGYAETGTDATLKQVAMTALPPVERHLTMVKGMAGAQ